MFHSLRQCFSCVRFLSVCGSKICEPIGARQLLLLISEGAGLEHTLVSSVVMVNPCFELESDHKDCMLSAGEPHLSSGNVTDQPGLVEFGCLKVPQTTNTAGK